MKIKNLLLLALVGCGKGYTDLQAYPYQSDGSQQVGTRVNVYITEDDRLLLYQDATYNFGGDGVGVRAVEGVRLKLFNVPSVPGATIGLTAEARQNRYSYQREILAPNWQNDVIAPGISFRIEK
jgi:hypothetical protein